MAELEDLQNTTNLEKDVRDIIGIKKLSDIKSKTEVSEKISTLVQFIVDEYGIFFDDKDEDAIEEEKHDYKPRQETDEPGDTEEATASGDTERYSCHRRGS